MLSQLWLPLGMSVQKGRWLASMLCLGSHTLDARRGRRIIYKLAVGSNIPVVVVSGAGAPSSRRLTLQLRGFIYKSAVGINIMVLVVSGRGAPISRQVTL